MVRSGGCFHREPTAETVQVGSRKPTRPRTNFPKFPSKRAGVHLQVGCRDAVHTDQHADSAGVYAAPLKKKKDMRAPFGLSRATQRFDHHAAGSCVLFVAAGL